MDRSLSEISPLPAPSRTETALSLPLAVGVANLCNLLVVPAVPLRFGRLCLHELGHAVVSWLSSRWALPLPIGLTFWAQQKSFLAFVVFALLSALGVAKGIQTQRRFLTAACGAGLMLQCYFTFLVPQGRSEMWQIYGGQAGEIYFAAILVIAFYNEFPAEWRWDFWRYPALLLGVHAFQHALTVWTGAAKNPALIPWGSVFGDALTGDLDRLRAEFQWTTKQITASYLHSVLFCAAAILSQYAIAIAYPKESSDEEKR